MGKTKDQKDLQAILEISVAARNEAYSLFSRRLDTRRNHDSFIALRDAFNLLNDTTALLKKAVDGATDTRASSDITVMDEIMIRSGRAVMVSDNESRKDGKQPEDGPGTATIVDFPQK
ncbi:MAG TPA: hypothetical protein VK165_02035 [Azonexus sp.]|nr:hypothetical protein [Azonexus sp.]